jgi:CP family cyanate transporter-like MFS transporter
MGVYSMALSGSAAVAAGTTVPIGDWLGHGWRGALGAWAAPAAVALLGWILVARSHTATIPAKPPPGSGPAGRGSEASAGGWEDPGSAAVSPRGRSERRESRQAAGAALSTGPAASATSSPITVQVTLFFGLQALSFYAALAWLPSVYRDRGFSPAAAGALLSISALMQIPITLVLPHFVTRAADQRWLTAVATAFTAAGLAAILLTPTSLPYLWMIVLGIGQGATFAIGLTLFVVRAHSTAATARLSATAQTFGYLVAAGGPLLFGAVHDLTGSWTPPLILLLVLIIPQLITGWLAGRARYVD